MKEQIILIEILPASAEKIYHAWLDSSEHGDMVGGEARIEAKTGGRFNIWDDYIRGVTLELEPFQRILQSWRTNEFPADAPDSRLEIILEEGKGGTRLTLRHSGLPADQVEMYRQGWLDYYLEPMKKYFAPQAD